MENFDLVSDGIVAWINRSESETDGHTLIHVTYLVYDSAIEDLERAELYAKLCRRMVRSASPLIQAEGIADRKGEPVVGGGLVKRFLISRCQEDFERSWVGKDANRSNHHRKLSKEDSAFTSDEILFDSNEKETPSSDATRRGLGLVAFLCELFKRQMLTERVMHECVRMLLRDVKNPREDKIEGLCKMLATIGSILDTPKARSCMDIYFSRMKDLSRSLDEGSKGRSMLQVCGRRTLLRSSGTQTSQDIIALRERRWVSLSGGDGRIGEETSNGLPPNVSSLDTFSLVGDAAPWE